MKAGRKKGSSNEEVADLNELDEFFRADEVISDTDSDEDDFAAEKEIIKSYSKIVMPFVKANRKPFSV